MDKLISVGFEVCPTVVLALRSTAIDTLPILPCVLYAVVDDISLRFVFGELICRELAAWEFAAIDTTARKQACKFGYGNAKQLL